MTTSKVSPFVSSLSAQSRTLRRSERSSITTSKLPPLAAASLRTSVVAASALAKSRAAPTTCAPRAARDRAVSTPRPAEAPVTIIRLPRRLTPDRTSSVVEVAPNTFAILSLLLLVPCEAEPLLTRGHFPNKTESGSAAGLDNRRLFPVTGILGMAKRRSQPARRKARTDAQRNRERILEVAKEAFKRSGANTSLGDIATQAGVGAGTLYRHFPTRGGLVEAVYRTEVEKLGAAEGKLAQE